MPAFTAAAAYLVTSFFGATFAATIAGTLVTSIVAAGIATVTSRIINGGGSGGGGGTAQDPGVRIQLPPATNNKVPVIYGTVNTKSTCVDARISADNQQMTYVLVLGEKTQTGTFTVGDIYWNDERLVFDTGANTYKVASSIDQNGLGASSTNLAGLIEVRVYAGSAQSSTNQIFPTTNKVSAASYVGETTSTYLMSDLVYAVVKLTYNGEKGVTNLQQMTFEVSNSLNNPGLVLYDYLTSPRYGAGIAASQIDSVSMTSTVTNTSLYSISNQIPPNQFDSNGSTSTQARYVINGVLSTGDTVKNNLEKITQACASWLTYDFAQGKWSVIVNRELSAGELAALVTYDDDSIMGEVTVNATNLEDLFNAIEVEFPNREIRDQNDYYRAEIAQVDRNDLEPDNKLGLRYDLVNNAIHAQRLGLIELVQSRVDKTIQFRTTYKGLQTSAGDVIKVTNEVYGFSEKLFRVTRVREVENDDGSLFAEITALEYDADVYGDNSIVDYQPNTASGIPSFGGPTALPAPGVVSFSQVFTNTNQPYFTVRSTIDATSGPVDRILWYYSTSPTGTSPVYITDEVGPFYASQVVTDSIVGLPGGTYYLYAKSVKDGATSAYSPNGSVVTPPIVPPYTAYSNGINWNPQPGGVNNGSISTATFSSQVQIITTATGALKIPLVSSVTGFQPVYADTDLSFDASSNLLSVGGLALSTGTTVQKVVSAGGYPVDANGTALISNASTQSVAMIVSNYSGNMLPRLYVRAYGQNTPGGGATTAGSGQLVIEGARGTGTAPTASGSGDSVGAIQFSGYDGANWLSNQSTSGVQTLPPATIFVTAAEAFANNGSTTTNAGTTMGFRVQPLATQLNSTSRRIFMVTSWTAGSTTTNTPPQLNLGIGQGADGTNPTLTPASGVGSFGTGSGRTVVSFNGVAQIIVGVPGQDTAPDNAGITATNILTFATGRRSSVSGRRDALVTGDVVGQFNFNAQTAANQTGNGSTVANMAVSMLENSGASARGTQFVVQTVNSGTTTSRNRLLLTDRLMQLSADQYQFNNGTYANIPLTFNTSTWNSSINSYTFGNTAGTVNMLIMDTTQNEYRNTTHKFTERTGSFTALNMTTSTAVFTAIPVVPTYTTATVKLVTGQSGAMVAISNATPAGRFAYWDTTNSLWKYIADDSTVTS